MLVEIYGDFVAKIFLPDLNIKRVKVIVIISMRVRILVVKLIY